MSSTKKSKLDLEKGHTILNILINQRYLIGLKKGFSKPMTTPSDTLIWVTLKKLVK